jgi:hypothetical protein
MNHKLYILSTFAKFSCNFAIRPVYYVLLISSGQNFTAIFLYMICFYDVGAGASILHSILIFTKYLSVEKSQKFLSIDTTNIISLFFIS